MLRRNDKLPKHILPKSPDRKFYGPGRKIYGPDSDLARAPLSFEFRSKPRIPKGNGQASTSLHCFSFGLQSNHPETQSDQTQNAARTRQSIIEFYTSSMMRQSKMQW